jgi:hypothetical protein
MSHNKKPSLTEKYLPKDLWKWMSIKTSFGTTIYDCIKSALENAKYPKRIHFGICRQYHPDDKFDDLSEYKNDKRFKIYEC